MLKLPYVLTVAITAALIVLEATLAKLKRMAFRFLSGVR